MAIDVTKEAILIDGIATENIAQGLAASGMASADIINLIGHMYVGYVGGKGKPAFRFKTVVEAADADCEATFARTFDHVDWIDGVSRVQAGMTPEELGFNARFHAIEADLDAVEDQFGRLSSCVLQVRGDLVGIVKELEAKLTDVDRQIQELKDDRGGGGGSPIVRGAWEYLGNAKVADKDVIVARRGDQIVMSEVVEDMISGGTVVNPPHGGGFRSDEGLVPGGVVVDPSGGAAVVVPQGGLIVTGDRIVPAHGGRLGIEDVVAFNDALEGRVAGGRGERTIEDVRAGGDPLMRAVTEGLDDEEVVTDAGLVNVVTERVLSGVPEGERRALRTDVLREDVADRTSGALMSTGVVGLTSVSESDAEVLSAAGFGRIGALSGATVEEVLRGIEASGGILAEDRVRAAVAGARVARALRRR